MASAGDRYPIAAGGQPLVEPGYGMRDFLNDPPLLRNGIASTLIAAAPASMLGRPAPNQLEHSEGPLSAADVVDDVHYMAYDSRPPLSPEAAFIRAVGQFARQQLQVEHGIQPNEGPAGNPAPEQL